MPGGEYAHGLRMSQHTVSLPKYRGGQNTCSVLQQTTRPSMRGLWAVQRRKRSQCNDCRPDVPISRAVEIE